MPSSMHNARPAAQQMDSQQVGTNSLAGEQIDFLVARRACPPVNKPYLLALPTFRRALRYSVSLADMEPKQIYEPLGMDKATWSRIESGNQAFPPELLSKLSALTGNDAPLIWLAHHLGYDLRPLRSELEEQLEQERAHSADLQRRLDIITDFIRQTRP